MTISKNLATVIVNAALNGAYGMNAQRGELKIDSDIAASDNLDMSTEIAITGIPSDILSDGDAVIESILTGRPLDEKTAQRIEQRAARITAAIYQEHGYLDIAVPSIRELRDS